MFNSRSKVQISRRALQPSSSLPICLPQSCDFHDLSKHNSLSCHSIYRLRRFQAYSPGRRRRDLFPKMHTSITRAQNVFGFFTTVCFVVAALIACSDLLAPRTPSASVIVKDVQVFVILPRITNSLLPPSRQPPSSRSISDKDQRTRQTSLLFKQKRRIRTHQILPLRRLLLPLHVEHETTLRLRVGYLAFYEYHK